MLSSSYFAERLSEEERRGVFHDPYLTDASSASPPPPSYWSYAAPDPSMLLSSTEAGSRYGNVPATTQAGFSLHTQYLPSMPAAGSRMIKAGAVAGDQLGLYAGQDLLQPYEFNNAIMAGIDVSFAQMEPDSSHQVNLSRGYRR